MVIYTHIFLVILVTIVLIIFAEYQKLRKISWILLIVCVTYILLTVETNTLPQPTNGEYSELINIDSFNLQQETNNSKKFDTFDNDITQESNRIISDEPEVINEIQNLDIITTVIATDVVERIPIGISKLFLNDINNLFCFTAVDNTFKNNKIIHTWKYNGQDYFKSFIKVGKAPHWRCWSRITIRPEMVGEWQVTITDTVGKYLDSINFSIISTSE
jgi:hypothetical protein